MEAIGVIPEGGTLIEGKGTLEKCTLGVANILVEWGGRVDMTTLEVGGGMGNVDKLIAGHDIDAPKAEGMVELGTDTKGGGTDTEEAETNTKGSGADTEGRTIIPDSPVVADRVGVLDGISVVTGGSSGSLPDCGDCSSSSSFDSEEFERLLR